MEVRFSLPLSKMGISMGDLLINYYRHGKESPLRFFDRPKYREDLIGRLGRSFRMEVMDLKWVVWSVWGEG
jgi:hypothetical protein